MKFVDEFQNPRLVRSLLEQIRSLAKRNVTLMEICGTHTMAFFRHGIRGMLPKTVNVISGPGCPVCVTPTNVLDAAIEVGRRKGVILATFGDMVKVPGSRSSLEIEKALGSDIRVVYSALDALRFAEKEDGKMVVFLSVGFETTSPGTACTVLDAVQREIGNFKLIVAHKLIPPAMRALLEAGEVKVDGFICPGHVSTIIGSEPYEFIPKEYGIPCVIAGFEPLDILQSILYLLRQIDEGVSKVEIQYKRSVRPEGNPVAKRVMSEVFDVCDSDWRGLGRISESGLELKERFREYDALSIFDLDLGEAVEPAGCSCGEVLRGIKSPTECSLFGRACTPSKPVGPCMVSSEGTCAAFYRYSGGATKR
jgi:hydrogenase expression/formation protein HypD